jgi:hypothetical protein
MAFLKLILWLILLMGWEYNCKYIQTLQVLKIINNLFAKNRNLWNRFCFLNKCKKNNGYKNEEKSRVYGHDCYVWRRFLLLSFFVTATAKIPEALPVDTPLRQYSLNYQMNLATITVGKGKVLRSKR